MVKILYTSCLFASITFLCLAANKVLSQASSYQQITFDAFENDKTIGWLKLSRTDFGAERCITSESHLRFQVLFSFKATSIGKNRFVNNILTQASTWRTLNDKVKLDNNFQLREGHYCIVKGKGELKRNKAINHTVLSLYFNEPTNVEEVFSEVYLCFLPVLTVAPSVYTTPLPDGGEMTYTYVQGKLQQVLAKNSLATIRFLLRP